MKSTANTITNSTNVRAIRPPVSWEYTHTTHPNPATPPQLMIIHTIDLYRIPPFIPSQNYVVYNYKSIDVTKPGTYVKSYINYHICIKFTSPSDENGIRNAKKV